MMSRVAGVVAPFIFVTIAHADILRLNNGDNITGDIVSFKDGVCVFSTPYGSSLRISANQIKTIDTDKQYAVTFKNGDRITGFLKSDSNHSASIVRKDNVYPISFPDVTHFDVVRKDNSRIANIEKKQEEYSAPISYLSDYTVLLNHGETDVDFGFKYRTWKSTSSLPQQGPYQVSSYSIKKLYFYVSPKFGIIDRLSVWLNVPWTYTKIEDVSSNAWTRDASQGHIGDISAGIQYLLLKENNDHPSVTGSLAVNTPTGRKKYVSDLDAWKQPLNNSEGYWSLTPSLTFVRITDPVTFFGGISYEKTFETSKGGERIKAGDTASAFLGTGFALNNVSSLGSRFTYSWSDNMKYEGRTMKGTSQESESLAFYFSYLLSPRFSITPEVSFPLETTGSTFGVSMTRNF